MRSNGKNFATHLMGIMVNLPVGLRIRHRLQAGDLGQIIWLHGTIYAAEFGFDFTFEAYVAGPMADFARANSDRDRLWIVERDDAVVGSIAIVGTAGREAQLRWFLLDPSIRGLGLGRLLIEEAIEFARSQGYSAVFLWTVAALADAARLYRAVGFRRVEARPGIFWSVAGVEERYVLDLAPMVSNITPGTASHGTDS